MSESDKQECVGNDIAAEQCVRKNLILILPVDLKTNIRPLYSEQADTSVYFRVYIDFCRENILKPVCDLISDCVSSF